MISWPAFFTSWLNLRQLLKNVFGSSEIDGAGLPCRRIDFDDPDRLVSALGVLERDACGCPRRQVSRDIT